MAEDNSKSSTTNSVNLNDRVILRVGNQKGRQIIVTKIDDEGNIFGQLTDRGNLKIGLGPFKLNEVRK